jgi:sulfatase modifying factor 1
LYFNYLVYILDFSLKTIEINMKIAFRLLLGLFVTLSIVSCGSKSSGGALNSPLDPNVSLTTGWEYNNADYAGIEISPYDGQNAAPGLNFVEGGTFSMGRNMEDAMGTWNNTPRRVTVSSFYMDQYEVSNADWKAYMWWLNLVFRNTPSVLVEATPDTLVWARALSYNDRMINNYLRHPAYNEYPVVGITWDQAADFCLWRTDRVNEKLLVDMSIMEPVDYASIATMDDQQAIIDMIFTTRKYMNATGYSPPRGEGALVDVYGADKKVNVADGILYPEYRLPTEAEWEYAAYGLVAVEGQDGYGDTRFYPWDGTDFRSTNIEDQGTMLANFARGRGDYMGTAGNLNDGGDYTVPIWFFRPNDFGLYNMAGNVNEWVADVYRATSSEMVQGQNPFRGNSFQKPILIDSIIDGVETKVVALDKQGRVMYENQSDSTFAHRYPRSDLRNFKDGDPTSSYSDSDWNKEMPVDVATAKLYAPDGDTGEGMLSPSLTNSVRVYKGGGINDRAYYLNPATRRYMEQSRAKDDVGFRCAMDRIGPPINYDQQ